MSFITTIENYRHLTDIHLKPLLFMSFCIFYTIFANLKLQRKSKNAENEGIKLSILLSKAIKIKVSQKTAISIDPCRNICDYC